MRALMVLVVAAVLEAGLAWGHGEPGTGKTELGPFGRQPAPAAAPDAEAAPPLWTDEVGVHFPITTSSPLAQRYFDQGLRLAYAFNHAEARRAFAWARTLDPRCAACAWGEGLVLGPNINAPMAPRAGEQARAALAAARRHAGRASPRERALIAALDARYSASPKADRAALDRAWAAAMDRVAARFPGDVDIAVLHAEALMNLSPWDYWDDGGRRPRGRTAEIVAILERVLARQPDHVGAIHLYIHMVEASDRPQRAEPYADRLASLRPGPGAGHLVHMPSHIYYRVGRYRDSLEANRRAVAEDEAYLAQARATGIYADGYYPHNVHFVLVSAQMAGDGPAVLDAASKLERVLSESGARAIPWVQAIKAAPYFAHAQFSPPETVLALPDPGEGLPYVRAMWHYARGVAQAARGRVADARVEAEALARIGGDPDVAALAAAGVPAGRVVALARHVVLARIAQSGGDVDGAIESLRQAVALQDGLAYMEPPYWYYPVRQSLGAALLLAGRVGEAEAAFRRSLEATPGSGWALYGLAEALRRQGAVAAAADVEARLARVWAGDRALLSLQRL